MAHTLRDEEHGVRPPLAKRLDAIAWGVFFIWVGIAFLSNVGWGVGVFGVGVITLGTQVARRALGLRIERFWAVMGVAMLAWAGLTLSDIQWDEPSLPSGLLPIVFIALGIGLITAAVLRKR